MGESWSTGIWDEKAQKCYTKSKIQSKGGKTYKTNKCWPDYDVLLADGYKPKGDTKWIKLGCGNPIAPVSPTSNSGKIISFTDSLGGKVKIPNPGEFSYDLGTCEGRCRITTGSLTPNAKAALKNLTGKILDKSYITIKDQDGNLTDGPFKLCFQAKNAKNPTFYRFGGGGWVYFGGFWQGSNFCMWGNTSGNFVLVDQGK